MARKKAEPKAKPKFVHQPSSKDLFVLTLERQGIERKAGVDIAEAVSKDFHFANIDRIERLFNGLMEWMEAHAVEGGDCAASTTEALIALQHVSYRIFESMRRPTDIGALLEAISEAKEHGSTDKPTAKPAKEETPAKKPDDPSQLYR